MGDYKDFGFYKFFEGIVVYEWNGVFFLILCFVVSSDIILVIV